MAKVEKGNKAGAVFFMVFGIIALLLVASGEFSFDYGPLGYIVSIAAIIWGVKGLFSKTYDTTASDNPALREQMEEFIASYTKTAGHSIFLGSSIPQDRLGAAKKAFASSMAPFEKALLLYDDSAFQSGKKGLLVTEQFIYLKLDDRMTAKGKIPLADIDAIKIEKKAIAGQTLIINKANSGTITCSNFTGLEEVLNALLAAHKKAAGNQPKSV